MIFPFKMLLNFLQEVSHSSVFFMPVSWYFSVGKWYHSGSLLCRGVISSEARGVQTLQPTRPIVTGTYTVCLPCAAVRQRFLSSLSTSNILVCLQLRKEADRASLVLLLFVLGAGFFGLGGVFLVFFLFFIWLRHAGSGCPLASLSLCKLLPWSLSQTSLGCFCIPALSPSPSAALCFETLLTNVSRINSNELSA